MENNDGKPEDKTAEEDLDLGPEPNPQVTRPQPVKPKKVRNKKLILAWTLAVLMTLAAAAFAWLYFTSEAETPTQTEETATDTSDDGTDEEESEEVVAPVVNYEADIGKFRLELDADFLGVIEKLDGNFEGGPATSVEIGEKAKGYHGFYTSNPGQAFTIFAKPEQGATIATNSRVAALENDELAEPQEAGEFAGETTRVYQVDGLFSVRHIIWVKNGIVYEIKHISEDESHAAILRAVEAGFEFVD